MAHFHSESILVADDLACGLEDIRSHFGNEHVAAYPDEQTIPGVSLQERNVCRNLDGDEFSPTSSTATEKSN